MTTVVLDLATPATGVIVYSRTDEPDLQTARVGDSVTVDPTTAEVKMLWVERTSNGTRRRWTDVPDSEDDINYVDLVDVDPDTLDPTTPVIPAYQALIDAKADAAATTSALAGKQPIDDNLTAFAALAPADTQQPSYSDSLGAWTVTNPTGGGRLASARPITSAQAIPHNGGTAVLLTSTAISVGSSGGRPVVLRFGGTFTQTVVGTGAAYLVVKETTSGAVDVGINTKNLPNSTAAQLSSITWGAQDAEIGVVTTTRTFALYSLIFPASGSPTMNVLKNATNPLFLDAIPQ